MISSFHVFLSSSLLSGVPIVVGLFPMLRFTVTCKEDAIAATKSHSSHSDDYISLFVPLFNIDMSLSSLLQ